VIGRKATRQPHHLDIAQSLTLRPAAPPPQGQLASLTSR